MTRIRSNLCVLYVIAMTITNAPNHRYSTFVRIGSGLSYADYIWIRQKHWKPWGANGPDFLQTSRKGHEDKGDVYLEPEE